MGEFRQFIARGNVLDLAVAVIIGAAFATIVASLTDDIIMPLVGALLGGRDRIDPTGGEHEQKRREHRIDARPGHSKRPSC